MGRMRFSEFAKALEELEGVSSRNRMVELLAELFGKLGANEIGPAIYLLQGRVAPLYEPVEFGMSGKLLVRAIARAGGVKDEEVEKLGKKMGDLGKAAEDVASNCKSLPVGKAGNSNRENLSVEQVHGKLLEVARTGGGGSVEGKVEKVAELLSEVDPLSARYIVRVVLDTLRLGFSDMTMLEGLSWMIDGTKQHKDAIEKVYNIRPDLAYIAETVKAKGLSGLGHVKPTVGTPILMARGERLTSGKDIIEKIGKCAVDAKIDGFRLQIHFNRLKGTVRLFTRNLEDATAMYPDVVAGIREQIMAKEVIFEGEAVGYNEKTGEFLPFQETVQRKRKYGITEKALEIPLKLMCFDLLYKDGEVLLEKPYVARREMLEKVVKKGEALRMVQQKIVETPEELEEFFQEAISRGLEGVMAKRLDGVYQAGGRGWNWIKYKRSYAGKLEDTIDAVVMGYDLGQGKRVGFGIGALLLGIYNSKKDVFETISKMGTGLTDKEWKEMRKVLGALAVDERPRRYEVDKSQGVDVWVKPKVVVQVRADEITRSPVHTAGKTEEDLGYALRFPRLEIIRKDKTPEDATSAKEIGEIYKLQGRKKI
jgi:DNA ligase-1